MVGCSFSATHDHNLRPWPRCGDRAMVRPRGGGWSPGRLLSIIGTPRAPTERKRSVAERQIQVAGSGMEKANAQGPLWKLGGTSLKALKKQSHMGRSARRGPQAKLSARPQGVKSEGLVSRRFEIRPNILLLVAEF